VRIAKSVSLRGLTFLLISLPPAAVLRIILKYGQNIPWMDQWGIPGKILISHLRSTLAFSDFFQTHNESIKALTGLIWFLLARTGWNPRTEMVVTWLVTVALAIIFYFLLRKTLDGNGILRHTVFGLMVLFLFHPYGTEPWLTGLSLENALVILFLSAGLLVNSSSVPNWSKYLLTACFSLAATFSYANGMLLWVLICPALPFLGSTYPRQKSRVPGLIYLAVGLTCLFCYLSITVASPYEAAQTSLEFSAPLTTVTFLLHWLGAPFHIQGIHWSGPFMAAVFLCLLCVPICSFIQRVWQRKDDTAYRPWLLFALYTLITGVMVAVGRQSIGLETALAPRYFQHVVLLPIAVLPLGALVSRNISDSRGFHRLNHVLGLSLSCLMALLCTISVISQWMEADLTAGNTARKRARGAVALSFINLMPRNPELTLLNPHTVPMISRARTLIRHGILDLPLHQPLPVENNRPTEKRIDGLQLTLREHGSILVTGNCPNSYAGGEISHILLTSIHGDRPEKAFAVITPKLSRHPRQVKRILEKAIRFRTHVSAVCLEPGLHLLKTWIFDASSGEYTPLVNEWMVHYDADGLFFFPRTVHTVAAGKAEKRQFDQAARTILRLEAAELAEQLTPRKGVSLVDGRFHVRGPDPILLLPEFPCPAEASAAVYLRLRASHPTFVQLFYRNESNEHYTEQGSIWARVREGDNELYFTVPGPGLLGHLRLDPGNKDGVFELQRLEVREYRGDP